MVLLDVMESEFFRRYACSSPTELHRFVRFWDLEVYDWSPSRNFVIVWK